MFKNYLKISLRYLLRHKGYSIINIGGLAVGMACCMLILVFVQDELSFDRFHQKSDRIYRIANQTNNQYSARTFFPIASLMKNEFPQIETVVRLSPRSNRLVQRDNIRFYEDQFLFADSTFFEVFDFQLNGRDAASVLNRPYTIILTEEMALKYFEDENPIGQTLTVDNKQDYEITGIAKNPPHRSHFQFNFIASMPPLRPGRNEWSQIAYTYVVLKEGEDPAALEQKFSDFKSKYFPKYFSNIYLFLQPLTDIHLYSRFTHDISPQGNIRTVYLFLVVAFLILFIAIINYMNLATARSLQRARELSMRKVVGANRTQLIRQFLSESVIFALMAVLLAGVLVELFLPGFRNVLQRDLVISYGIGNWFLWALIGIVLLVGFLSGSYPAFFLSAFLPIKVLRGSTDTRRGVQLRKGLVVFQFGISVALIVSTLVIQGQLNYLQSKNLGFNKEQVLIIKTQGKLGQQQAPLKTALIQNASIESVSMTYSAPGIPGAISFFDAIEDVEQTSNIFLEHFQGDHDLVETLGMEIVAGRNLSEEFTTDLNDAVLINETAASEFGWKEPIGNYLGEVKNRKYVVGVVRDFHYNSLKEKIGPVMFSLSASERFVAMKVNTKDLDDLIPFLEKQWNAFVPSYPFQYFFLDDHFSKDFVKLVIIGIVLLTPLAYYGMNSWLQNFAYRIELGPSLLIAAGGIALVIALLTVSFQAIKAAIVNPVKSLRYE